MRHPLDEKKALRSRLRKARREHVAALNERIKALILMRPPAAVAGLAQDGAAVGLYHALPDEAPTRGYAKWFAENGHPVALPWFAEVGARCSSACGWTRSMMKGWRSAPMAPCNRRRMRPR
jgi:5-formyltetrahydrofolate cyclo-ligase